MQHQKWAIKRYKRTTERSGRINDPSHIQNTITACSILTYLLTPWCRILLEQLTVLHLVKKFLAFHGTRKFITALTSVRQLSLSWTSPIQSIYPHPTSWRPILILSTHLRLGLPSGLFPSGFPTKTLYTPPLVTHTRHIPSPSPNTLTKTNRVHKILFLIWEMEFVIL